MAYKYIQYDSDFDFFEDDKESQVFQIFPKVFNDDRGSFTEVLKNYSEWPKDNVPIWFSNTNWIHQINRSVSQPYVCRGMHAQYGAFCQSKLVECIHGQILDFIIDARPNSKTFGLFKSYLLDSYAANKVYVPRGFLHGFYSVKNDIADDNIFQYYIGGGTFNKESEICVNISTVLEKIFEFIKSDTAIYRQLLEHKDTLLLSDKDKNSTDLYQEWMLSIKKKYDTSKELWYK